MAQTGKRIDPYSAQYFLVEIDGISRASFREATGLESKIEQVEYREGGDTVPRKLPGAVKYSNIVLKRGVTDDNELYRWHRSAINGELQRRNGSIVLMDGAGTERVRWNFFDAWPSGYEGPDFNAESNDVAIETFELTPERVERVF